MKQHYSVLKARSVPNPEQTKNVSETCSPQPTPPLEPVADSTKQVQPELVPDMSTQQFSLPAASADSLLVEDSPTIVELAPNILQTRSKRKVPKGKLVFKYPLYQSSDVKSGREKGQPNYKECARILKENSILYPCQNCKKSYLQGKYI
jgi:hypothetical protein